MSDELDLNLRVAALEDKIAKLTSEFDSGDTSWVLVSATLVLFMTIPGLVLFYSGMVRTKNVLATVMQIFSICALISFLWLCFGYSLAFAPATSTGGSLPVIGDYSRFWLHGMTIHTSNQLAPKIPESVYCIYQLTFAIITPALICGSFADRMKYWPMLVFMAVWHLLVYCPIAHAVWHPDGFLFKAHVLDFAGGNVVEVSSGVSGLVSAVMLGHRKGYGKEAFEPYNILLMTVGAAMIWVGWFGFNGGSALTAGGSAGNAVLVSQIAGGVAAITWTVVETFHTGSPKVVGIVSGAISGFVAITPGSGYVDPTGGFFIGFLAGPVCYIGVQLKHKLGYDDALDAFGIHAIGGVFGNLMVGFFATDTVYAGYNGLFYGTAHAGGLQLARQLYGTVVCGGWAAFMSYVILKVIDMKMGLRISLKDELHGLDASFHNETLESPQVLMSRLQTIQSAGLQDHLKGSELQEGRSDNRLSNELHDLFPQSEASEHFQIEMDPAPSRQGADPTDVEKVDTI